jgi:hypothetical protein
VEDQLFEGATALRDHQQAAGLAPGDEGFFDRATTGDDLVARLDQASLGRLQARPVERRRTRELRPPVVRAGSERAGTAFGTGWPITIRTGRPTAFLVERASGWPGLECAGPGTVIKAGRTGRTRREAAWPGPVTEWRPRAEVAPGRLVAPGVLVVPGVLETKSGALRRRTVEARAVAARPWAIKPGPVTARSRTVEAGPVETRTVARRAARTWSVAGRPVVATAIDRSVARWALVGTARDPAVRAKSGTGRARTGTAAGPRPTGPLATGTLAERSG